MKVDWQAIGEGRYSVNGKEMSATAAADFIKKNAPGQLNAFIADYAPGALRRMRAASDQIDAINEASLNEALHGDD